MNGRPESVWIGPGSELIIEQMSAIGVVPRYPYPKLRLPIDPSSTSYRVYGRNSPIRFESTGSEFSNAGRRLANRYARSRRRSLRSAESICGPVRAIIRMAPESAARHFRASLIAGQARTNQPLDDSWSMVKMLRLAKVCIVTSVKF